MASGAWGAQRRLQVMRCLRQKTVSVFPAIDAVLRGVSSESTETYVIMSCFIDILLRKPSCAMRCQDTLQGAARRSPGGVIGILRAKGVPSRWLARWDAPHRVYF